MNVRNGVSGINFLIKNVRNVVSGINFLIKNIRNVVSLISTKCVNTIATIYFYVCSLMTDFNEFYDNIFNTNDSKNPIKLETILIFNNILNEHLTSFSNKR